MIGASHFGFGWRLDRDLPLERLLDLLTYAGARCPEL